MNGLDIEGVLAARFHDPDDTPWMGHGTMADTCILCAETAAILREQIAAAQAEAWAAGCATGWDAGIDAERNGGIVRSDLTNPYRAAQFAPARVPGGGGVSERRVEAACGVTFPHDWHGFLDDDGRTHVCDGEPRVPSEEG